MSFPVITALHRYPVKALSSESLESVELLSGEAFPGDRCFAITRGSGAHPSGSAKGGMMALKHFPKLAALTTSWDETSRTLTIFRHDHQVAQGCLEQATGRMVLEEFFSAYFGKDFPGTPKLVALPKEAQGEDRNHWLSLINLATVEDLARVVGQPVDPLRFRGNILIEGAPAWSEFDWIGHDILIGGARLRITERILRCVTPSINPESGVRDINIPQILRRGYDHANLGVFAEVMEGGLVQVGDSVKLSD